MYIQGDWRIPRGSQKRLLQTPREFDEFAIGRVPGKLSALIVFPENHLPELLAEDVHRTLTEYYFSIMIGAHVTMWFARSRIIPVLGAYNHVPTFYTFIASHSV